MELSCADPAWQNQTKKAAPDMVLSAVYREQPRDYSGGVNFKIQR